MGEDLLDHLAHLQQRAFFQTFGGGDEKHVRFQMRPHALEKPAAMVRRHDTQDDLGSAQRVFQAVGRADRLRNSLACEEKQIHAMA